MESWNACSLWDGNTWKEGSRSSSLWDGTLNLSLPLSWRRKSLKGFYISVTTFSGSLKTEWKYVRFSSLPSLQGWEQYRDQGILTTLVDWRWSSQPNSFHSVVALNISPSKLLTKFWLWSKLGAFFSGRPCQLYANYQGEISSPLYMLLKFNSFQGSWVTSQKKNISMKTSTFIEKRIHRRTKDLDHKNRGLPL